MAITNSKSLALYGGTFDPIHHGHLILARDAMEQLGIEKVIFLPAKISPFKLDTPPSPPETRLDMIKAAIQPDAGFAVDDRELRRQGPSYTIETVREYRAEFPATHLFFLIGDDNLPNLGEWKESSELAKLVEFVILGRMGIAEVDAYRVVSRKIEISSTEIRRRVAQGLPIHHLVPHGVLEIIRSRRLYLNPSWK